MECAMGYESHLEVSIRWGRNGWQTDPAKTRRLCAGIGQNPADSGFELGGATFAKLVQRIVLSQPLGIQSPMYPGVAELAIRIIDDTTR